MIQHISPQTSRILVGIPVNPIHDTLAIRLALREKLNQYKARLAMNPLSPSQIQVGYTFFLVVITQIYGSTTFTSSY